MMRLKIFGQGTFRNILRTKVTIPSDLELNLGRNDLYTHEMCITDCYGKYTYLELCGNSKRLSMQISNICGSGSNSTVAFINSPNILTIVILWATWMSGQQALPLSRDLSMHQYNNLMKKTNVSLIISPDLNEQFKNLALKNGIVFIHIDHKFLNYNLKGKNIIGKDNKFPSSVFLDKVCNNLGAIVTYSCQKDCKTALIPRKELERKIKTAAQSWTMSKNDSVLYVCPSYCTYNYDYIFNLLVPVCLGCQVNIIAPFDGKAVWRAIMGLNIGSNERPNILIAEPKVFYHLIIEYNKMFSGDKMVMDYIKYCVDNIRLISCFYRSDHIKSSTWLKITGHPLQESIYPIESFDSIELTSSIKLRIVNPTNKTLLEVSEKQAETLPTSFRAVIGRLMKSIHNQTFHYTGEIVSYCNGVFKIIGRYKCTNN